MQASFHSVILCKLSPTSSLVRPVVLQASPPIMSEAAQAQVFLILFTDTQNLHWKPFCSVCPHTVFNPSCCLSPAHTLSFTRQTAAWLQCKGKAPTLTHFSRCIFPSQCTQQPGTYFPASVHEELSYFLWALVYSTFQTFRQNFACAVLRAYQTTVQWSVSPPIYLSLTRAEAV